MNRMAKGRVCLLWLLAGAILVSCAAGCGGRAEAPAADPTALAAGTPPSIQPYRLRPGDAVAVKFAAVLERAMDYDTTVTPNGTITVPYEGEVQAAGRTTAEIEADITEKMSAYLLNPLVSVVILNLGKQPLFVIGEVGTPGRLESVDNLTISAALAQAGGILKSGKPSSVMVVRTTGVSEPVAFRVDVTRVLSGRDLSKDVVLLPNDVVYVPKSVIGKIDEFVNLFFEQIVPAELFYLYGYDIAHPSERAYR
jgi:protein involved in polysaccharide export with SLBB domain